MSKFKITINNVGLPPSAEIGILCDNQDEAEVAFNVITSQNFVMLVECKLFGPAGETISEAIVKPTR